MYVCVSGVPGRVYTSHELPKHSGWEELVKDVTVEGFSFDKSQNILWIKFKDSDEATVSCY